MTNDELMELGLSYVWCEYRLEKTYGLDIKVDELFRHAYEYVKSHVERNEKTTQEQLMDMYNAAKVVTNNDKMS